MRLLTLLGVADATVVIFVLLYLMELVPWNLLLFCILFLGAKAVTFHGDIASILDGCVALVFLLLIFDIQQTFVLGICLLYLVQKAVRSLTI